MALDDDIAVLTQAPLFNLLEKDALRLVAFASENRTFRAGDVLFRKGDRSDGGYVVSQGAIALDALEDGSPETFLAGPGALIGQAALFARIERRATATAREPSTIIRLPLRIWTRAPSSLGKRSDSLARSTPRACNAAEKRIMRS